MVRRLETTGSRIRMNSVEPWKLRKPNSCEFGHDAQQSRGDDHAAANLRVSEVLSRHHRRRTDDVGLRLDRHGSLASMPTAWRCTTASSPASMAAIWTASARRFTRPGFAMPMLCCSPDFTNPDADGRKRAVEREVAMIAVTRRLGGPGAVCRVLSGQRYPEVQREQGLEWVVECIHQCLPAAREHDIILGLENHYKDGFWKYPEFAQKKDVFLALLAGHSRTPSFRRAIRSLQRGRGRRRSGRPAAGRGRPRRQHARQRSLPGRGGLAGRPETERRHHRLLARIYGTASPARGSTITTASSGFWPSTSTKAGSASRTA